MGDAGWDAILDPEQGIAVNAMTTDGLLGMCLFDEQGMGKTVMTIAAFDLLKKCNRVERLMVVCPKSMLSEWSIEFSRFLPSKYRVVALEGDQQSKYNLLHSETDVFVMNFESVTQLLTTLTSLAGSLKTLLVVDESFFVKNPDANRSVAVGSLREACERAIVLCGTPAPNAPEDVIHQFNIADAGYTFGGFSVPDNPDKARDAIFDKIQERGVFLRRLKKDSLPNLPDKQFNVITVPLERRQRLLYDTAREELVLFLRQLDNTGFRRNLATYFQKRAALLQICVSPALVDPLYDETPAKYARMDEMLQQLICEEGRKVVIWSYYRRTLDELASKYEGYGLVRVDGSVTSSRDRRIAISQFQDDPNTKLFIGNPAAAGAGITLHSAADAIYVSYSNQAAHYLQSLDRIHRRGQTADIVRYHLMICRGTIEESEILRLRNKEIGQHALLGDDVVWPSSLDEALSELGATP